MHKSMLMEPRTLQAMADACHGERLGGSPNTLVTRVCTDSRQVQFGDLFIPLRGERYDGHAFLGEVIAKGVAGALAERSRLPASLPSCGLIAVENTRTALGKIAARYRRDFDLPLIAVAGSNGKTTTKEILAAVLRQRFKTLASQASFNNNIGVPVTLLELESAHQAAVLEFGTNHPGELAPLLRLAQPRFGVLPSIGREHLEFFEDLSGVVEEEGWLAELIPADGKLFVNGDTPGIELIAGRAAAPVVKVGFGLSNDWVGTGVRTSEKGVEFDVRAPVPLYSRRFHLPLLGKHQVINALLAIAVGAELGLTPEEVQRGFDQVVPAKMRLQLWKWNEVLFLDDSYNANADSMRVALETLRDFPCHGRRMAVLGDMAELGSHAKAAHAEIGGYAALMGLHYLIVLGENAPVTAEAARVAGLQEVRECTGVAQAAEALRRHLLPGDLVLLKASRAMKLERVGELLRQGTSAMRETGPGEGEKD